MKHIVAIIILIVSLPTLAGDLLLGEYTHHFNKYQCEEGCAEFKDSHALLGYSTEKYAVMVFDNSYGNTSVVALRTFQADFTPYLRPFVAVGLATGYEEELPQFSLGYITTVGYLGVDIHPKNDKIGVIVSFVPAEFVGIGFRIRI